MRAWLILAAWTVGDWITSYTYHRHLTTDPACKQYRAPRAGSALDRHSRGVTCTPCMARAALGDHECRPFPVSLADLVDPYDDPPPWQGCEVPPEGWWCSRTAGHDGPCAARPNPRPHSTGSEASDA